MDKIEIRSIKNKFLSFFEKASVEGLSDDEKWIIWKSEYDFAALPPTDEYDKLARKMLFEAWDKYNQNIDYIKNWNPDQGHIEKIISQVKNLLGYKEDIDLVIFYYVGAYDGNLFVGPSDNNRLALNLPIEYGTNDLAITHEMTHIIHGYQSKMSGGWVRSLAAVILQEGLATQACKALIPNKTDEEYVVSKDNWLSECIDRKNDMFMGIMPYLNDSSNDTLYRFLLGKGTTGVIREAYYVGWELVKNLLQEGITFETMASIKEDDIPKFVEENLRKLIK